MTSEQRRSQRGEKGPQTFCLSARLQYTSSASRRWNARKALFVGKFGLREAFFSLYAPASEERDH